MKVLHIINSLSMGGAEKLIAETVPLFREKGISVEILLLNGKNTPLKKELIEKEIPIRSLGEGSVYHPAHIFRMLPFLGSFDIVHVHLFPAQYFVAAAKLMSGSKAKLLFTEHSTTNRRIENPAFKLPEKIIYAAYDKIIAITEGVKSVLQQHIGLADSRIEVIENGIDTKKIFNALPVNKKELSPELEEKDILLLQVSGFRVGKDQATAIKALQHLPGNVKLLLVGDGVTKPDHEKLVKDLGLRRRVLFLGIRNDIPQLLKTAEIILLSSHFEGLSLASLEGMASGKPFIGSDVAGIRDLVQGYGILFPDGDEKQLAAEINRLLSDKTLYSRVAAACRERAAAFDIQKMVDKTVDLYVDLPIYKNIWKQ